jgi:hypothetical protein
MDTNQRKKILWRIPLIVTLLSAMSMWIWSLAGTVQAKNYFAVGNYYFNLPFSFSLWWLILIVPIVAFISSYVLTAEKAYSKSIDEYGRVLSLMLLLAIPNGLAMAAMVMSNLANQEEGSIFIFILFIIAVVEGWIFGLRSLLALISPSLFIFLFTESTLMLIRGDHLASIRYVSIIWNVNTVIITAVVGAMIGFILKKINAQKLFSVFTKWISGNN